MDGNASSAEPWRLVRAIVEPAADPLADSTKRNKAQRDDEEFGKSMTPYGTLIKKLPLVVADSARNVVV